MIKPLLFIWMMLLVYENTYAINIGDKNIEKYKNVVFYIPAKNHTVSLKLKYLTTYNEKIRGLMFEKKIEKNQGLLFKMNKSDINRVWMKNMLIPIDIIFLSENGEILGTVENASPCAETEEDICPKISVRNVIYVVETYSGFIMDNFINYSSSALISNSY